MGAQVSTSLDDFKAYLDSEDLRNIYEEDRSNLLINRLKTIREEDRLSAYLMMIDSDVVENMIDEGQFRWISADGLKVLRPGDQLAAYKMMLSSEIVKDVMMDDMLCMTLTDGLQAIHEDHSLAAYQMMIDSDAVKKIIDDEERHITLANGLETVKQSDRLDAFSTMLVCDVIQTMGKEELYKTYIDALETLHRDDRLAAFELILDSVSPETMNKAHFYDALSDAIGLLEEEDIPGAYQMIFDSQIIKGEMGEEEAFVFLNGFDEHGSGNQVALFVENKCLTLVSQEIAINPFCAVAFQFNNATKNFGMIGGCQETWTQGAAALKELYPEDRKARPHQCSKIAAAWGQAVRHAQDTGIKIDQEVLDGLNQALDELVAGEKEPEGYIVEPFIIAPPQ